MAKYIFVVGGVMSGVGKGVAAASIGAILKSKGLKVTSIKADPYINVDAGTMNPTEHGEVFVTIDGDETDQDMGNYERFLNQDTHKVNYMTTGRIYEAVIKKERNLEYEGRCVQVVPHIPEEIIGRIEAAAKADQAQIVIMEIGGTVGEYENVIFLEAIRMLKLKHPRDVVTIMVSFLPVPSHVGEMKTKPTQMAVRHMNGAGLQPDFILCRGPKRIDAKRREKLAVFCNIDPNHAISAPDVNSIYEVPVNFEKENLGNKILQRFGLKPRVSKMERWGELVSRIRSNFDEVKIGIVGKYFSSGEFVLSDAYISVIEAVKHASWKMGKKPIIEWLNAEDYEGMEGKLSELKKYDGIIVPGGFGNRGIEGKINVARFCRENDIPYFGLCYGMQIATIEFARNVCELGGAHTEEIDPKTKYPVIHTMADQIGKISKKDYGGTMRLGGYRCKLLNGTMARDAYGKNEIIERHRHRYEFNNEYKKKIEAGGMRVAGVNPEQNLVEIVEIPANRFFVGVQFHPELQSRPLYPHPLFVEFIRQASK